MYEKEHEDLKHFAGDSKSYSIKSMSGDKNYKNLKRIEKVPESELAHVVMACEFCQCEKVVKLPGTIQTCECGETMTLLLGLCKDH